MTDHFEPRRDIIEDLGDVLSDADNPPRAIGAATPLVSMAD
jgi:hypothetical protein